ncbi:aspartate-alanine antiporter [Bordetella bronchialis]|uniref:Aspartate-alanine antiporter n=1 Tax=Bordetella bronchialis TaxID=463025 RepID=A0A193FRB4_9BORD|nr:aspartate-alanine antiporter [Bordetella bronchialis]ANN69624.1 aspartate-alanine antiporter [Bordetella bronchialis]ANN74770.1 aspartate-alanine antiporter [Bordetella bronchialis]
MDFDWIVALLRKSPELALFMAVPIGYVVGNIKLGKFSFGTVTGALIAGLFIGQAGVDVDRQLRWSLFYLFLFANGYSAGPQFFQALRRDGAKPMVLSLVIAIVAVPLAVLLGRLLGLDPGLTAGLFSGALTQSAVMGTATDAIMSLPIPPEMQRLMASHVAVADALTYVFGAIGAILFISVVAPRILRVDLRAEAALLEQQYGIKTRIEGVVSGYQRFAARAYQLRADAPFAGRRIDEAERARVGLRYFVERVRRGNQDIEIRPDTALLPGDVAVVYGRTEALVAAGPGFGTELHEPELLDFPVEVLRVVVTNPALCGPTLQELVDARTLELRSVGMRTLTRGGQDIPFGASTRLNRGDVVELIGAQHAVEMVAARVGYALRPTNATNLSILGFGILIGAAIGLPYLDVGAFNLTLGTSVGVLLAGLFFGWLRTVRPGQGEIPQAALDFMITFGLAGFVACAGLQAGPEFLRAVRELGLGILLAGVALTLLPMLAALLVGRYVLRMNPVLLLGALAGAQTFTAALAAVQEKAGSKIPVLGYTVPYATSNILLTTCGAIVVVLAAG